MGYQQMNIGIKKMGLGEKDYTGAIADFSKAIELDPENKYAYYSRGTAKYELEDYIGAIADYSKAIEITPKNASAYYYRGLAKIKLGQKDNGCLDLSKAGELGDSMAYYWIKQYCN